MSAKIEIQPVSAPLNATIRPPGSKSLTNRALICAALADGTTLLTGALASEDTRVMIDALKALGIAIEENAEEQQLRVKGCSGRVPATSGDLYIANSGTSVRFLAALVALGRGKFRLHGTQRMHERPIQDLIDALTQLGVNVRSETGNGCPPITIEARGIPKHKAHVRGDISSQFLSGLLMVAPYAASGSGAPVVQLEIDGELVSQPYVTMTLAVMEAFAAKVEAEKDLSAFRVHRRFYRAIDEYAIEPDASAASYFWAAAAIAGGRVRVDGLGRDSVQGDVGFCECLRSMGCEVRYGASGTTVEGRPLVGIDVDMNGISDTVQTLAAVALFAKGPTTIRGVGHIRHKETDRIGALATELRKLGATVDERPDGLRVVPGPLRPATIDTYHDHRMAMSLSLVGLKVPGVAINDPDCTAKTYPEFFDDLARLRPAGH